MKLDPQDVEIDLCLSFNEANALKGTLDNLVPIIRQHGVRGPNGRYAAFSDEVTDAMLSAIQAKVTKSLEWVGDPALTLEMLLQLSTKTTPAGKLALDFLQSFQPKN